MTTRLIRVLVRVDGGPDIEIGHEHVPEYVADRVATRRQLAETLEGPA